jgi:hypothetical protein
MTHMPTPTPSRRAWLVALALVASLGMAVAPGWAQPTGFCTLACSNNIVEASAKGNILVGRADTTWQQVATPTAASGGCLLTWNSTTQTLTCGAAVQWFESGLSNFSGTQVARSFWSNQGLELTNEALAQRIAPGPATVTSMRCTCTQCPGISFTRTFSLRINGAQAGGTGTCNITGAGCPSSCTITGTATFATGDRYAWSQDLDFAGGGNSTCSCAGLLTPQ